MFQRKCVLVKQPHKKLKLEPMIFFLFSMLKKMIKKMFEIKYEKPQKMKMFIEKKRGFWKQKKKKLTIRRKVRWKKIFS